ncbi:ABC transporter permease [bacterium]|nr:ABC transporter permease [bacterium]
MSTQWIALRVIQEIIRDRRTLAIFFVVPIIVMSLVYYALIEDEVARVGVLSRGTMRLFESNLVSTLEEQGDVLVVSLDIPDKETDPVILDKMIKESLLNKKADGILYLSEQLLMDRFDGKRGTMHIYVEGSRPTLTASVLGAIASSMDDLASSMPVVIDTSCSALCADSVNIKPMILEKHYLYGSDDYRMIDYFLPVLPPFFIFFFTFIISTITFQRERVRGTLERLLIAPISFTQVVLGYIGGFFIFSVCQSLIILVFILSLLGFAITLNQILAIIFLTLLLMLISLVLGLLASFLAANEFQAMQFIPLVILPQIFLSDIIWSVETFPRVFQWISKALPLTHANTAMRNVLLKNQPLWQSWQQLLILSVFFLIILVLLIIAARKQQRSV